MNGRHYDTLIKTQRGPARPHLRWVDDVLRMRFLCLLLGDTETNALIGGRTPTPAPFILAIGRSEGILSFRPSYWSGRLSLETKQTLRLLSVRC